MISTLQRELGLVLAFGDGCISKQGSLMMSHSEKQADYLLWKQSLLQQAGVKATSKLFNNSGFPGIRCETESIFREERATLYREGRKTATPDVLSLVIRNPLYLSIWFMDDGSLIKKRKAGASHFSAREARLSTESFTLEEHRLMQGLFADLLGIKTAIHKSKRGMFHLWMNTANATKLIAYIGGYVVRVPSMVYKADFQYRYSKPNPVVLPQVNGHGVNSRTKAGHPLG